MDLSSVLLPTQSQLICSVFPCLTRKQLLSRRGKVHNWLLLSNHQYAGLQPTIQNKPPTPEKRPAGQARQVEDPGILI